MSATAAPSSRPHRIASPWLPGWPKNSAWRSSGMYFGHHFLVAGETAAGQDQRFAAQVLGAAVRPLAAQVRLIRPSVSAKRWLTRASVNRSAPESVQASRRLPHQFGAGAVGAAVQALYAVPGIQEAVDQREIHSAFIGQPFHGARGLAGQRQDHVLIGLVLRLGEHVLRRTVPASPSIPFSRCIRVPAPGMRPVDMPVVPIGAASRSRISTSAARLACGRARRTDRSRPRRPPQTGTLQSKRASLARKYRLIGSSTVRPLWRKPESYAPGGWRYRYALLSEQSRERLYESQGTCCRSRP